MNTTIAVIGLVLFGLAAMICAAAVPDARDTFIGLAGTALGGVAGVAGTKALEVKNND